jgi:hypothetical protein
MFLYSLLRTRALGCKALYNKVRRVMITSHKGGVGGAELARWGHWITHLWWCLLVIPLVVHAGSRIARATSAAPASLPAIQSNCTSTHDGITYCLEDAGDIHVVIIDLENPHVRFEMVMAEDVTSVDTTRRERIEEIVGRPPYQQQEVVVAINADYFGLRHGPEGFSVKNGRRLDGGGTQNNNPHAIWRSSLAISRLNRVYLGRKNPEELNDPRAYRERFYNAIGGGPLILNYGVVIPNTVACVMERFPVGACRRTIQTAAGLSGDGRWLYLAVGQGRDIAGFARLLRDYGAFTAIKLDGGGSSQLWYDGAMRHDTDRPVGNALLVFYSREPRHDARLSASTPIPVVEPGARVTLPFEIENTGFLEWEPDLGYRFKNVRGWPVVGSAYERLPEPVPAGGSLPISFTVVAPHRPGVYEVDWQLVRRTEAIGPSLWFGMVVLPPDGAKDGFREEIEALVERWRSRSTFQAEWTAHRQELETAICNRMVAILREATGDEVGLLSTPLETAIPAWWEPACRPLSW